MPRDVGSILSGMSPQEREKYRKDPLYSEHFGGDIKGRKTKTLDIIGPFILPAAIVCLGLGISYVPKIFGDSETRRPRTEVTTPADSLDYSVGERDTLESIRL